MMNTINGVGRGSHRRRRPPRGDARTERELRHPAGRILPALLRDQPRRERLGGQASSTLGEAEYALATMVFTIPGTPLDLLGAGDRARPGELRFFDKEDEIDWTGWEHERDLPLLSEARHAQEAGNAALWHGLDATLDFLQNDDPDVLVYVRASGDSRVVVILNLSGYVPLPLGVACGDGGELPRLLWGRNHHARRTHADPA
ncbi:MAG: alpha-glucosidase C-terminal domain-containing protein [Bacillus subtilis]|nr:alpha-glucosidase C-terminal domain-containing protein [Bacillus subtilis]